MEEEEYIYKQKCKENDLFDHSFKLILLSFTNFILRSVTIDILPLHGF